MYMYIHKIPWFLFFQRRRDLSRGLHGSAREVGGFLVGLGFRILGLRGVLGFRVLGSTQSVLKRVFVIVGVFLGVVLKGSWGLLLWRVLL